MDLFFVFVVYEVFPFDFSFLALFVFGRLISLSLGLRVQCVITPKLFYTSSAYVFWVSFFGTFAPRGFVARLPLAYIYTRW